MNRKDSLNNIALQIPTWAKELGFQDVGITDIDLSPHKERVLQWLNHDYHGSMLWLKDNVDLRLHPEQLFPGTARIISARMNYFPQDTESIKILKQPEKAYISRYALGRDYHKVVRKRLALLAKKIHLAAAPFVEPSQRAFVDSAPILERQLAEKAGLGWTGKHTLLIHPKEGSWFFLGEILTNIPFPISKSPIANQCGDCDACLKVCPTDAFPMPYQLDARRCISFLTIENKGSIPIEFREVMGNRVFGCDDCQAICPWNRLAKPTDENDFQPRHDLDDIALVSLFLWDENEFLKNTEGSAIRRVGYECWLRNLAIGLGNAPPSDTILNALKMRRPTVTEMVKEHIDWAIEQQQNPRRRKRKIRRDKS